MAFKIPAKKCVMQAAPKRSFAKNFGFRWVKSGSSFIMVGCPKGKAKSVPYMKKKLKGKTVSKRRMICTVGTKAFEIVKARRGKCAKGYKPRG